MKVIERNESGSPKQGTWRMVKRDAARIPKVSCPGCGQEAALIDTHSIGAGGVVTPSLDCPVCDFHDHVTLGGLI